MLQKDRLLRQSDLAVFDRKAIANILGVSYPSTNPILDRLVRAGILTRLKRDRYVLTGQVQQMRKVANELKKPSAISLWTALSDAGLTTQVPRAIQSVTPKRASTIGRSGFPEFQYVHLPEPLFFGMQVDAEGVFQMLPEKALLDLLYIQKGEMDWSSIDVKGLDQRKIAEFAVSFPEFVQKALSASPLL